MAKIVNIEDFVEKASKKSHAIKATLNELKKIKILKDLRLNPSLTILNLSNDYGLNFKKNSHLLRFRSQVEHREVDTGRTYSLEFLNNKTDTSHTNQLTLKAKQSLWKNAFGRLNKILESKANLEISEKKIIALNIYEDIIESFMLDYLRWQKSYLKLNATKDQLISLEKLSFNIKQRYKQSIAHIQDVKKMDYQILLKKESILRLKEAYKLEKIKIQNLLETNEELSPSYEISKSYHLQKLEILDTHKEIEKSRQQKLYTLKESITKLKLKEIKEKHAGDLSLFFSYEHNFNSILNTVNHEGKPYIGLSFNYQLDNVQKKAEINNLYIEKEQNFIEKRKNLKENLSQIKEISEVIKAQIELLEMHSKKNMLAKDIIKNEIKRYEQGEIEIQNVIDAEAKLIENKYIKLEDEIKLTQNYIRLMNITDILVTKLPQS